MLLRTLFFIKITMYVRDEQDDTAGRQALTFPVSFTPVNLFRQRSAEG